MGGADNVRARSAPATTFGRARVESLEGRVLLAAEPWSPAAKLIGQDLAVANYPSITGAGMAVAVIDTGVDYRHPALGGGIGATYKVQAGYDFLDNDPDPFTDTDGHGTGVAGVIAADRYVVNGTRYQGVAPGAKVIALRGNHTGGVKAALDWVYANRAKYNIVAVNLTDFGGASPTLYGDAMRKLIGAGVFVSRPAGNQGPAVPVGKALDPADTAVSSVNWNGQVSAFSQRGVETDLLAPGERVTIPYYNPAKKSHIYATSDGTSWAAPAVAGAAALIKQIDARFTPAQILKILQDSGASVYDGATKLTYKRLDLNAALGLAYQRRPGVTTPKPPLTQGPTPAPVQTPFSNTPIRVAGATVIEAENFDDGGEGVAYHDADTKNLTGSAHRKGAGVDVRDVGAGRVVEYVRAGEWLEYTLDVPVAGTFNFTARVAADGSGGRIRLQVDGVDQTGPLTLPDTGAWHVWARPVVKTGLALPAGRHVLRVAMDGAGQGGYVGNFDWFKLTPATAPAATAVRSAFATTPATSYTMQSGVAAFGHYVAYLDQGDWLAYERLDFGAGGAARFTAAVAAAPGSGGKKMQVRLGSPTGTVLGTIVFPATGGWTTFKSVSISIPKVTGVQNVYLTFSGGNSVGNVQSIRFN